MNISTYGSDERLKFCREYLLRSGLSFDGDIMILPIPTTRDGTFIYGTDMTFDDIYSGLRCGDALVGYDLPRGIREELAEQGALIIDVSRDEVFMQDNAALTSDGTVGRILTEHNKSLCDLKIGIIGYGRIGQRLLNSLMFFGAKVTVFTSKKEARIDLCMLGVSGIDPLTLDTEQTRQKLSSLDILINTAPAKLIPESFGESLGSTRVIELASGNNIPQEIPYERFASVPALMYPASAGYALGRAVARMLGQREN